MADDLYTLACTGHCEADPHFEADATGYDPAYGPSLHAFGNPEARKSAFVPIDLMAGYYPSPEDVLLAREESPEEDDGADHFPLMTWSVRPVRPVEEPDDLTRDLTEVYPPIEGSVKHRPRARRRAPRHIAAWMVE